MSFLRRLKAPYSPKIERKYTNRVKRRQFNVTITKEIIEAVRLMASALEVPTYVVTEHLLQVGAYAVLKAIKDNENRQKLQEHLVKRHLIGNELHE
jgi:uncharacterized membrane-anchored protein YjiN (DUF445 family)